MVDHFAPASWNLTSGQNSFITVFLKIRLSQMSQRKFLMAIGKPQDYTQSTKAHSTKQTPFVHCHDFIRWKDRHSSSPGSECRELHCRFVWCISPQSKREHLIPQILISEKVTQPKNFNWAQALGSFLEVTHRHGMPTWLVLASRVSRYHTKRGETLL